MGFQLLSVTLVILFVWMDISDKCRIFLIDASQFSISFLLIQPSLGINDTSGSAPGLEIEKWTG